MVKKSRNGYVLDDFVVEDEDNEGIDLDPANYAPESSDSSSDDDESSEDPSSGSEAESESAVLRPTLLVYDDEEDASTDSGDSDLPLATVYSAKNDASGDKEAEKPSKTRKKPPKNVVYTHTFVDATPAKQRIHKEWTREQQELHSARLQRNSSAEKVALLEAKLNKKRRNREKRAKKAQTPTLDKPPRRVKGGVQLLDLRRMNVATLPPLLTQLLRNLLKAGCVKNKSVLARQLNVTRPTLDAILATNADDEPPEPPVHPQIVRAKLTNAALMACWAELSRPSTAQLVEAMQKASGHHMSARYIRKVAARVGLLFRKPRVQQLLTADQKATRLAFAQEALKMPPEWFKQLVFTDESYFEVKFGENGCWLLPGQRPPSRKTVKHPDKRMIWLGIGFLGERRLTDAFIYAKGCTQDGPLYVETLKKCFEPLCNGVDPKPVLVQDGARTHTCKVAMEYFSSVDAFTVMPNWPPSSPDLNPIENLWRWIGGQLMKMSRHPATADELIAAIRSIIAKKECIEVAERLHESFKRRLEKCVAENGGHIGY